VVYIIAWISDVLDGFIARRFNMVSDFGKFFDPLADKLMSITALVALCLNGQLSWVIPALVFAKELSLGIGGLLLYKRKNLVNSANWSGKIATFIFTIAIVLLLFENTYYIGLVCVWIAVAASIIALIVYIREFFGFIVNKQTVDKVHNN
jgi:cardiolipin synthase